MSSYFQNTPSFPFDKAWTARKDYYEKQQFYAPQSVHKPVAIAKPGFERIQATGSVGGYAGRNDRPRYYGQRPAEHTQQRFNTLKSWSKWSTRLYYL